MAFNLPGSRFVGVDLSMRHVEAARDTIRAVGLENIRIEHASITDIDRSWGEFDYIICHGVFSWVDGNVQQKILEIAAENLAPAGVAYVSYNTYPGWHMRESVRHMMRYHASRFHQPSEQITQARALLDFLAASVSANNDAYGQLLNTELEKVRASMDWYLFHEHLEPTNSPLYFYQFIERARRVGLQYLSEADLPAMLSQRFPPPVAEILERISPDILHLEQYMDFVRNRLFRQTLLCHDTLRPQRALGPALLHRLMASSRATVEGLAIDLAPGTATVFHQGGCRVEVEAPAAKVALAHLVEQWPRTVEVDQLCTIALESSAASNGAGGGEQNRGPLMEDLFRCFVSGLIELHTFQPPCAINPSDAPRANRLAAYQGETQNLVVNACHEMITLDSLDRKVLPLLDGIRSRAEVVEALAEFVQSGELVRAKHVEGDKPEEMGVSLSRALDKTIADLARAGVLLSSSTSIELDRPPTQDKVLAADRAGG